jgi:phage tail sheath gpL-like
MGIQTGVPSNLRRPQVFVKFVYQKGGRGLTPLPQRTVLIGTAKGTAVASTVYTLSDADTSDTLFLNGTPLALMSREAFAVGAYIGFGPQLYAVPVAELGGSTARTFTFTIGGTATASDNLIVRIAGRTLSVSVNVGDLNTAVATGLNGQINAFPKFLPVTSGVAGGVVTGTATTKGKWGNDIAFSVENVPTGLTCVAANGVSGAGTQDETNALAAVSGVDYDTIALENHDTTSVALALSHVQIAWGISEKKWRWIVYGETGTIGTATSLASAANDKAIVVANCEQSPSLCSEIATAVACAITSKSRPNANWDGQELPLWPPPDSFAFTNTEQETALAAGITPLQPVVNPTTRIAKAGVLAIVKLVTTQTTLAGQPFEILRDLAVPRAGAFIARQLDAKFAERFSAAAFPDGVLLDDDALPRIKDMAAAVLYDAQDDKIITNVDNDLALLVVEKDSAAPGRVNIDITYTVVIGLHQVAFVHRVQV